MYGGPDGGNGGRGGNVYVEAVDHLQDLARDQYVYAAGDGAHGEVCTEPALADTALQSNWSAQRWWRIWGGWCTCKERMVCLVNSMSVSL